MSGVFSLIAVILSFGITALLGKWLIPFLKRINFGQTIREEGPKWHIKKDGTPTMGGIMSVSYTHLDVYKRQRRSTSVRSSFQPCA